MGSQMRIPSLRLEQLDDEAHHGSRSVELAALLAGVVGELVDQVLVGVAQDVAAPGCVDSQVLVAQVQVAEVVEQAADNALAVGRAAELGLVVPVCSRQHAVQPWTVGFLDGVTGHVEGLAQVHGCPGDGGPAGGLGNEELVLVAVREGGLQWHAVGHRILDFLFESVGESFKEEDREDVVLVVRRVDLTAQNVGGSPKPGLQFLPGERHRSFSSVGIGWGTGLAFDLFYQRVSERVTPQPGGFNRRSVCRLGCFHEPGYRVEIARGRHGDLDLAEIPGGKRLERGAYRYAFGELRPSMGRRQVVPKPVAHARLRRFRSHHQHRDTRHRPGHVRRDEDGLDRSGARRHQHVVWTKQVPFGSNTPDQANLPQAAEIQPAVIILGENIAELFGA